MKECMARLPYATLIATVMCSVGVGVFCGTMYRGVTITMKMADDVFHLQVPWQTPDRMKPVQVVFVTIGAVMGVVGILILLMGCLATGATRTTVYRGGRARTGGRVTAAILMVLVYVLHIIWLLLLCTLIVVTILFSIFWALCSSKAETSECIDFTQFHFLFPKGTEPHYMEVCDDSGEMKGFCKDYVESAEIMFILASAACFLVILSLLHYMMCLSANYAHIKDNEKFCDLEEIQRLHESEMSTLPKDRF